MALGRHRKVVLELRCRHGVAGLWKSYGASSSLLLDVSRFQAGSVLVLAPIAKLASTEQRVSL